MYDRTGKKNYNVIFKILKKKSIYKKKNHNWIEKKLKDIRSVKIEKWNRFF